MTLAAAIVAFINSVLAVVSNFGVSLDDNQKGSIVIAVNAASVLGALIFDKLTNRRLRGSEPGSAVNGGA